MGCLAGRMEPQPRMWWPSTEAQAAAPASFCPGVSHPGMLVDGREAAARASPAAEAGLLGTSMSSPEEELAAVLHRTGCGREVVSFSAINKMFQRQVASSRSHSHRVRCPLTLLPPRAPQARRLDTQRQQQEQNRQAIEQAMESMQADLEVQKLQANRQVRFPPFCRAVPNSDGHAHAGGRRSG